MKSPISTRGGVFIVGADNSLTPAELQDPRGTEGYAKAPAPAPGAAPAAAPKREPGRVDVPAPAKRTQKK